MQTLIDETLDLIQKNSVTGPSVQETVHAILGKKSHTKEDYPPCGQMTRKAQREANKISVNIFN